ncbi:restriction endonuclease subunit S [Merdimonas faecis]|uniref:restriction endonuclease subunit S n=1 Tax=Merdimonas faecis TaxID=1653435 RepID=UPI000863743B|nr:restriction endonuclease subunit S [Merdimonas faecis]
MTPQELKNSILQLAIQGKLVEQRPEEGTAEELFLRIQEEKQRLIAEKKIKKEKPLPEITEDEKPFDIPESWKWVRFGTVISLVSGTDFKPEEYNDQGRGTVYITGASNLSENGVIISRWTETPRNFAYRGDILLVCKGSGYGKTVFCDVDEVHIARQIMAIKQMNSLNMSFTRYFLQANLIYLKAKGQGVIPGIDRASVLNVPFPLPPLVEQKRIVAKIEELLPYIDRYEQAWSKLEKFNSRFPEDMKRSLLQYAIQGKLVEQRSEEGTAEELFEQIQKEKHRLIKEKKIKKEKPLPEITDDEKPFDIPESWKWVRIQDISWFIDAGKSPKCNKQPVCDKEWGVITTTAIQKGFFDEKQNKVLPQDFVINPLMQVHIGDILITRAGPTNRTGVACLVKKIKHNLILSDKTLRINMTNDFVYKNYIVMAINSPPIRSLIIDLMSGMDKQQVNISQNKYKTLLIPLPPLAEQRRIVEKLELLLPLCERLK